jgi:predicted nucleic acid-binding protein
MPGVSCFVDTNILLYSVSLEPNEEEKGEVARQLLTSVDWGWSAQVAAEFINAATARRRTKPLSLQEAARWLTQWDRFPMVPVERSTVQEAIRIADSCQIAYFDAQIVAAAKQLGCSTLYSEDLNDGQDYGGVRVVNPFRALNTKT